MRLIPNHEDPKFFVSSRITEFLTHREAIYERFFIERVCPPFRPWIFEYIAPQGQHDESVYLNGVATASIFVIILGDDLSEAVVREYKKAKELKLTIYPFIRKGANVDEYKNQLNLPHYNCLWSTPEELCDVIEDTIHDHIREIQERANGFTVGIPRPSGLSVVDAPPEWLEIGDALNDYCNRGDFDGARRLLQSVVGIASSAENVEARNLTAYILRRENRFDEAMKIYDDLLRITESPRFALARVVTLSLKGDSVTAREVFENLSETAKESPIYLLIAAQTAVLDNNPKEALRILGRGRSPATRRRLGDDFWNIRGQAYGHLKRHFRAYDAFRSSELRRPAKAGFAKGNQAFHLYKLAEERSDNSLLADGLTLVERAIDDFQISQVAVLEDGREFAKYLVGLKGCILHILGRSEESLEFMESYEGSSQRSVQYSYNIALLRFHLFGEPVPWDLLEELAFDSKDETALLNLWGKAGAKIMNEESVDFDLDDLYLRIKAGLSGLPSERFVDATMRVAKEGYGPVGPELLEIARDPSQELNTRINALNFAFVGAGRTGDKTFADEAMLVADQCNLWSLELLDSTLQAFQTGLLSKDGMSKELAVLEQVHRAPEIIALDKSRAAAYDPSSLERLGSILGWAGRNQGRQAEVAGLLAKIGESLTGKRAEAFERGFAMGGREPERLPGLWVATRRRP